ncbi:hypothetical protein M3P05_12440 [Sansalvadorimonas sp. 2012CJ34-2]|uniref:Uncharacterized protein n=1 Tax=Parendozoicomonas callyspongiae TaxID=2942213 RepID=A0ABT0PJT4_9GAMM|nr:hypothetical protein [Sansalvadorimonas sp. 2012CJ34-2]MCL6270733.1 hypothetical protein [Sansalvadorimonas sp. 2012CJ34-2]
MKKYFFPLILLLSGPLLADSDTGIITMIESEVVSNHQALQISFGEGVGNRFCNHVDARYPDSAYLAKNAPNFDAILAISLSAYMAGKTVTITTEYSAHQDKRCVIKKVRLK